MLSNEIVDPRDVPDGFAVWYHGSATDFQVIDLSQSGVFKDFGPGFYLGTSYALAVARARTMQVRRKSEHAYVYVYFVPQHFSSKLKVRVFKRVPSFAWLDFIQACWSTPRYKHGQDVIMGPTADSHPQNEITRYKAGVFGAVGSDGAKRGLIAALKAHKLGYQMCLATKAAVQEVKFYTRKEV